MLKLVGFAVLEPRSSF